MTVTQGNEGIRWGRVVLAAVIVEILLGVLAAPVALLSADPVSTLNTVIPPASFLVVLLVVMWLVRRTERPVANGVATGLMCLLIYILLMLAAYALAPERMDLNQSLAPPNVASYLLRLLGGAVGGWWIARSRSPAV